MGLIPGLGRSPGEGNGTPLQYSCLENPMDGGDWWDTLVHGVTKSRTDWRLHFFSFSFPCVPPSCVFVCYLKTAPRGCLPVVYYYGSLQNLWSHFEILRPQVSCLFASSWFVILSVSNFLNYSSHSCSFLLPFPTISWRYCLYTLS